MSEITGRASRLTVESGVLLTKLRNVGVCEKDCEDIFVYVNKVVDVAKHQGALEFLAEAVVKTGCSSEAAS